MAASRPTGASALQFRVMRLPRPTLEIESPLGFAAEDLLGTCVPRDSIPHPSSEAFERRLDLFAAEDASGMTGMLLLPQNFGVVHLGETFASYVSVSNSSDRVARDVAIKVELQTNRRRVALFDNAAAPLPAIQPGASYDFIVEHDLKELGAHTLACSVGYGGRPHTHTHTHTPAHTHTRRTRSRCARRCVRDETAHDVPGVRGERDEGAAAAERRDVRARAPRFTCDGRPAEERGR